MPRLPSAARGFVVAALALVLASLLNAQGLRKTAEIQPQGARRTVAVAVTKRLVWVSHALFLDRPRQELKAMLGRGNDDRIDTTVALPPVVKRKPPSLNVPRPVRSATPVRVAPARPVFSPANRLRVWVGGDSLVEVPGLSLEREAGTSGPVDVVAVESRIATGLGRPDIYNWFERFPQAIREFHPRVAVLSFGADDGHNYMSGVPADVTLGPLGSPSWDAEYERRLTGVTKELGNAGVYVVWLGLPIIRGPTEDRTFETMNRLLKEVVAAHPRTSSYIDTYDLLQNPAGHYSDYLRDASGQLVLMRAADGVHYESPAGDLIAKAVLARLGRVFDLTARKRRGP
jgi:hypothetical protein